MAKSTLGQEKQEIVKAPQYTEAELTYLKGLRLRMENARDARNIEHEEFDGMDYETQYELCERLANTYTPPKRNKEDTNYQSGIIRQKIFALLAPISNLNLSGDISAFDKEGLKIQAMGDGIEDIILKTNELDSDDEKKLLRQYELLKHGTVFVEEIWDERSKKVKNLSKKWDGKINGVKWEEKIQKAFARPSRNIVPGLNVYLGDITQYEMQDQPFVFTVDTMPYDEAERIFGEWERWGFVPKTLQRFDGALKGGLFNYDWRLLESRENQVEILRYQDKWNNEFSVVLNGVLMTPVGLPLPWGYEEYNIVQQNLEPIHAKFAYGKSLIMRVRNKVALFDEMERLAVLKTQKSFAPPYLNISGRVLSNRVLMPGKITHGIAPGTLVPINEKETQGVTNAELAMIQEIKESINFETTSPTFSGQQAEGNPTATEIIELQRQAKLILGLTIFAVSMLEWKLEWLRLKNILKNWFVPEDQVVDEARGMLKGKYRQVGVQRSVDGEGMGQRLVIPTKSIPDPNAIMQAEEGLTQEQGMPVRLIFLNPDEVCSAKLVWQIVVRPKERRSSETDKLLNRAFLQDMMPLGADPNFLRERTASVWGEDPQKVFPKEQDMMNQLAQQQQMAQEGGQAVSPRSNLPTPEKAFGNKITSALKA